MPRKDIRKMLSIGRGSIWSLNH